MDKNSFFKDLYIEEQDYLKANQYISSKGLFFHVQIKNKLLAWIEGEQVKYSQIASYYRYDKRIRIVLYKYISYLEEYYRAFILDNFCDDLNQNFWIPEIKNKINSNEQLHIILEGLGFKELIKQTKRLPDRLKIKCLISNRKRLRDNLFALKELRNAVMHNKFLLMHRGFAICYFDNGKKGSSLRDNILNLISFLPKEVGVKLREDIDKCSENRNVDQDTKWDLIEQAIVSLD